MDKPVAFRPGPWLHPDNAAELVKDNLFQKPEGVEQLMEFLLKE